jgi:DNA-binding GntR family transcriptional regulator
MERGAMKESLKEKAYHAIGRMILSGALVPGEYVNRRAMARNLEMSVAPVLEAMVCLEAEGLLETLPRHGTRVRIHRVEDVRGAFLVREALECQVARLVHGAPVRSAHDQLLVLAQAVDDIQRDGPDLWEAEVAFHCALADLVGSPMFVEAFRKAMRADLFYKLRQAVGGEGTRRRSHVRFLRALRLAENAEAADALARTELRHGKEALGLEGTVTVPTRPRRKYGKETQA